MLALVGWLHFEKVPGDSPYKLAFYFMGVPLLFWAATAWRNAFYRAADVLTQPSLQHILALVSNRGFLVLVIIYFAVVCVFYGGIVRRRDDRIDSLRRDQQMILDECGRLQNLANAEPRKQSLEATARRSDAPD